MNRYEALVHLTTSMGEAVWSKPQIAAKQAMEAERVIAAECDRPADHAPDHPEPVYDEAELREKCMAWWDGNIGKYTDREFISLAWLEQNRQGI